MCKGKKSRFLGEILRVSTYECLESKKNGFMLLYFSETHFHMFCLYLEQRAFPAAWEH